MKTEKELMEWVASKQHYGRLGSTVAYGPQCVDASDLSELFKDMKLVPADAVVLTVEDAEFLHWACGDVWDDAIGRLAQAIEQAKGQGDALL